MSLETVTYISDLVQTNPTSSDPASQGDDHLRNIKKGLLTTFPNVKGAVTPTHTELNYVKGVTSSIQTQINNATSKKVSAGDGLSGGGDGTEDRTLSVNSTVVRTSGDQTIAGGKKFTGTVGAPWLELTAPTPNIDFHYGSGTSDFDVRLINDATGRLSLWGNFSVSGVISGNGSGLTSLNASNLSTGTVADARLTTNVAKYNTAGTFTAGQTFKGGYIIVQGSSSTTDSNIFLNESDGTPQALLSAPPNSNGAYLQVYNADASGYNTFFFDGSNGRMSCNQVHSTFIGDGSYITNLTASNLSGYVPDANLTTNVPLKNASNSFSGSNTFNGQLTTSGSCDFASLTVHGSIDANTHGIVNLADPSSAQGAATKHYVDAQIDLALQGASYGAVGTYVFAVQKTGTDVNAGSTISGSNLSPAADSYDNGTHPFTGTWRAMGFGRSGLATLWLRVS